VTHFLWTQVVCGQTIKKESENFSRHKKGNKSKILLPSSEITADNRFEAMKSYDRVSDSDQSKINVFSISNFQTDSSVADDIQVEEGIQYTLDSNTIETKKLHELKFDIKQKRDILKEQTDLDLHHDNSIIRMSGILNLPTHDALSSNVISIFPSIYRLDMFVPYVGDQRSIYSCSAWAVSELQSIEKNISEHRKFTETPRIHDEYFYSPSFIYTIAKENIQDSDCQHGINIIDALNILKDSGTVFIKSCPYYKNDFKCCCNINSKILNEAKGNKIKRFEGVKLNIIDFQYVLSHNCPIAVETYIDNDFLYKGLNGNWSNDKPFVWDHYGSSTDRSERKPHSMVCVGYNDNTGAFLMVDSHGDKLGNDGFFWIDYKFMFEEVVTQAYHIVCEEYNNETKKDKELISKINSSNNITKENEIEFVLDENGKGKVIYGYNFKCTLIDFIQNVAHLKINKINSDQNIVLRKDLPVSNHIAVYFTDRGENYVIELEGLQKPVKKYHGLVQEPPYAKIVVTRIKIPSSN